MTTFVRVGVESPEDDMPFWAGNVTETFEFLWSIETVFGSWCRKWYMSSDN